MNTGKVVRVRGLNLSTLSAQMIGTRQKGFAPMIRQVFANGEQGFFYDPNDLGTMFQDADGTIPVTASGQPVGLILDRSGNGNHAFQSNSASRPILQQTAILGSELVVNGHFSNDLDGWQFRSATATVENGKARVTYNGGGGLFQDIPVTEGTMYRVSYKFQNHAGSSNTAINVYGSEGFSTLLGSSSSSEQYLYVTAVSSSIRVYLYKGSYGISSWDDVSVKEVEGYRNDKNYLLFDGSDDFLQTSNIDFTDTNKMSLFAGVRKLSDSGFASLYNLSSSVKENSGTFVLYAPSGNGSEGYSAGSNLSSPYSMTMQANSSNVFKSPISNILTTKHSTNTELWIDGVLNKTATGNKGGGNYGNYPLYIGRHGGITLPFNGRIYGLIGVGKIVSEDETTAIEKYLAKCVGVSLNV